MFDVKSPKKYISSIDILAYITILTSIIPSLGVSISIPRITLNAYRMVILLDFFCVIFIQKKIILNNIGYISNYMRFLFFWIIYGCCLLGFCKYADQHEGAIEIGSLICGFITVYIISVAITDEHKLDVACVLIYWILNLLLIMGLIEIFTGNHLATSGYRDPLSSLYGLGNENVASGFMYNPNDFSALITILTTVLLNKSIGRFRLVTLLVVVYINVRNDANTCNLAIAACVVFYLLVLLDGRKYSGYIFRRFFFIIILLLISAFFVHLKYALVNGRGWLTSMANQINNFQMSMGSLYRRTTLYKETILAWLKDGFWGMGPCSFTRYFTNHPSITGLVNPHSLMLEILLEYGILIDAPFIILLIKILITAVKKYYNIINDNDEKDRLLMVICFVIVYFISSFSPSTFLKYPYQWIMIAVMCLVLDKSKEENVYA